MTRLHFYLKHFIFIHYSQIQCQQHKEPTLGPGFHWSSMSYHSLIPSSGTTPYTLSYSSIIVKNSSTSKVSESAIRRENEKRDKRIQRKARIRGPTPLQGEGAKTESKPALLYFSAVNERTCRELNYNSCGLQGQRTK